MKIFKNNYFLYISLLFLLLPYLFLLRKLPIFGDGAAHGAIFNQMADGSIDDVDTFYPLGYFLIGNLFQFLGLNPIKTMVVIGLFLIMFFAVQMLKNIFSLKNQLLLFLSAAFIVLSPKIIFYSSRMYMEIFLSSLIIGSIYFFLMFIKKYSKKNVSMFFFFLFLTVSVKQQGFILVAIFFISILILKPKIYFKKYFILSSIVFLIFSSLVYLNLAKRTGEIIVENEFTKPINKLVAKLISYDELTEHEKINEEIDIATNLKESSGHIVAEKRHIWPTDVLTNFEKSNSTVNLYDEIIFGLNFHNKSYVLYFIFILMSMVYLSINDKKIFIFSTIFIFLNVITFIRGNDQERYYLYIPIYFSILSFYFIDKIIKKENKKNIFSIVVFIFILVQSTDSFKYVSTFDNAISYRPIEGGIYELINAGKWLNINTNKNDLILALPPGEWENYSKRKSISDDRLYFIEDQEKTDFFLKELGIDYIAVPKHLILEDDEWNQFGNYSKSFYEKISNNYTMVYQNEYKNIEIYKIN